VTSKPCRGCQPLVVVGFAHHAVVAGLTRARKHAAARRGGVDLIPRESTEAGGHAGETTTMVLVPEVLDLDVARPLGPFADISAMCVTVGYGVCRNPRSIGGSSQGGLST